MTAPEQNKTLALNAFDTLFNKRDHAAAGDSWPERYVQHGAHIAPGRAGLLDLIRSLSDTLRYEQELVLAEGDHVMLYGRFAGTGSPAASVAADVVRIENGKLAEHWGVLQDEATCAESLSGLPMSGDRSPPDLRPVTPHGRSPAASNAAISLGTSGRQIADDRLEFTGSRTWRGISDW
ncbi:nuclear transport factor 2 family protein [Streptomyces sp. NPDC002928]|uniref:nuclear transport factor 2 family protein n=1 Tax=Streptomyces sp. NPDC002928 TaxID=3154440 RepID=UPI0033B62C64